MSHTVQLYVCIEDVCIEVVQIIIMPHTVQVEQGFLDEHNAYRREVNRDALVWDPTLAKASKTSQFGPTLVI